MYSASFLALAASITAVAAQHKGFNYGNVFTNGAAKQESDFLNEFTTAQNLIGTSGFTSARLYTMIQAGTANTPISAIPAAISTKTSLLLGLWASAGQASFDNEVIALQNAINQYGTAFTDLIVGISVGSEDLYRISPTGIENKSGLGANPDELVQYIKQTRAAIASTSAAGKPIGHVDTWTAYVNTSNADVISNCDWIGVDAYPYFQTAMENSIENSKQEFFEAFDTTINVAQGKDVWVTETGWPVSGEDQHLAVANAENARKYWEDVGCTLFGTVNTWWYTLQDSAPDTPSPSFGIVGNTLSTTPLFDLTCPGVPAKNSTGSATGGAQSSSPATGAAATGVATGADAGADAGAGAGPNYGAGGSGSGSGSGYNSGSGSGSESGSFPMSSGAVLPPFPTGAAGSDSSCMKIVYETVTVTASAMRV